MTDPRRFTNRPRANSSRDETPAAAGDSWRRLPPGSRLEAAAATGRSTQPIS